MRIFTLNNNNAGPIFPLFMTLLWRYYTSVHFLTGSSVDPEDASEGKKYFEKAFKEFEHSLSNGHKTAIVIENPGLIWPPQAQRTAADKDKPFTSSKSCYLEEFNNIYELSKQYTDLISVFIMLDTLYPVSPDVLVYPFDLPPLIISPEMQENFSCEFRRISKSNNITSQNSFLKPLISDLPKETSENLWDSVAGYDAIKDTLIRSIEWPFKYANTMKRLGIRPIHGILLHGPPGNSKTSLARIAAQVSQYTFFNVNSAELYSCYLGESERLLRETFENAKKRAPAIIFIDEIDSLVGTRSVGLSSLQPDASSSGSGGPSNKDPVQERVLSTLLNELDGVESLEGVIIIGATNRIDKIDDALLRPGRFDKLLFVGPPDAESRWKIMNFYLSKVSQKNSVPNPDSLLAKYSLLSEGFSGADCKRFIQEACMIALRRHIGNLVDLENNPISLLETDFEDAFNRVKFQ